MVVLFTFKVLETLQQNDLRKLPETDRKILLSRKESEEVERYFVASLKLQDP